jgi:hypothetical protein
MTRLALVRVPDGAPDPAGLIGWYTIRPPRRYAIVTDPAAWSGVTTYSADDAQAALAGLIEKGDAVTLADPILIGDILTEALARNAILEERITAARQDVFPYLREPTLRGELALNVEAALAPRTDAA